MRRQHVGHFHDGETLPRRACDTQTLAEARQTPPGCGSCQQAPVSCWWLDHHPAQGWGLFCAQAATAAGPCEEGHGTPRAPSPRPAKAHGQAPGRGRAVGPPRSCGPRMVESRSPTGPLGLGGHPWDTPCSAPAPSQVTGHWMESRRPRGCSQREARGPGPTWPLPCIPRSPPRPLLGAPLLPRGRGEAEEPCRQLSPQPRGIPHPGHQGPGTATSTQLWAERWQKPELPALKAWPGRNRAATSAVTGAGLGHRTPAAGAMPGV